MPWKIRSLLFLILSLSLEIFGQSTEFTFNNYGVAEGISTAETRCTVVDAQGQLWIGSSEGLNCFDGTNCTVFKHDPEDENSICHDYIRELAVDKEGNLWIATQGGISQYNPRLEIFENILPNVVCDTCLLENDIGALVVKDSLVFFGTRLGVGVFNYSNGEMSLPEISKVEDRSELQFPIKALLVDNDDLIVGGVKGLAVYNCNSKSVISLQHNPLLGSDESLAKGLVEDVYKDDQGNFWISSAFSGLQKISGTWTKPIFTSYNSNGLGWGSSHFNVRKVRQTEDGLLWVASYQGLSVLNPKDTSDYNHIFHHPDYPTSLANNQIEDIYVDNNGLVWNCTFAGVSCYNPYFNQFKHLTHKAFDKQSLASNETFSILEDSKKTMWFGNYTIGASAMVTHDGTSRFVHFKDGEGDKNIKGFQVLAIEEDYQGRIWMATFGGLNIIDWPDRSTDDYSISKVPIGLSETGKLPNPYMYNLQVDKRGRMWTGTHGGGIVCVEEKGGQYKIQQWLHRPNEPMGYSGVTAFTTYLNSEEQLLIGDRFGKIYFCDTKLDTPEVKELSTLSYPQRRHTYDLLEIDSNLWVSGENGVQIVKDYKEHLTPNVIDTLSPSDYITIYENLVYNLLEDKEGNIWFDSKHAIHRYSTETGELANFKNTFLSGKTEFNMGSATKGLDGTLYFGTGDGVVHFNPQEIETNNIPPNLILGEFLLFNKKIEVNQERGGIPWLTKSPSFTEKISLKSNEKMFSLKLGASSFTLPDETIFSYKLIGFDDQWTRTDYPVITFTNLSPGTYTFVAKAANNDEVWSDDLTLEIEVLPPWWMTWWAYLIYALAIFILVSIIIRIRVDNVRKIERARENEREEFRKRSSRDFHDEAGNKITKIGLVTELAKRNAADNKELSDYLNQIEANVQDLNSGMRDFMWSLDPSMDNLYQTLSRLQEFANSFFQYSSSTFNMIGLDESFKKDAMDMASRRHLLLIFKEAINNCMKYSEAKHVTLTIGKKKKKVRIELIDDGKGFKTKAHSEGYGLKNMEQRAKKMGGKLEISSDPGRGTHITLFFETTQMGN